MEVEVAVAVAVAVAAAAPTPSHINSNSKQQQYGSVKYSEIRIRIDSPSFLSIPESQESLIPQANLVPNRLYMRMRVLFIL